MFPLASLTSANDEQVRVTSNDSATNPLLTMYSYQCNRGVSILEMNETRCLCPPAYYGRWCEFYSDRISIIANVDRKTLPTTLANSTLKLRATLFFNNATIDSQEFNIIPAIENATNMKHKFYLLYSRSSYMLTHKRWRYFNRTDVIDNHPYSLHFDVFSLETNDSINEVGSWHYQIYFDFLPAFRLAVILKFPSWFGNTTFASCLHNNCSENATCMPIFNRHNSYYCSCKSGYYGKECSLYEPICESYCSINALCRRDDYDLRVNKSNLYCICQFGRFGPRCHLKYDDCDSNPCWNGGTCRLIMDRSGELTYMCGCSQRFYGNQCQNEKSSLHVVLNMTNTSFVHGAVVQLYHIERPLTLVIQYAKAYHGLPATVNYEHNDDLYAPYLGVLKSYQHLTHPKYFIMYLLRQLIINITSSPEHCPHASSLLSECEFVDK